MFACVIYDNNNSDIWINFVVNDNKNRPTS